MGEGLDTILFLWKEPYFRSYMRFASGLECSVSGSEGSLSSGLERELEEASEKIGMEPVLSKLSEEIEESQ
jgi:hypothetical protein